MVSLRQVALNVCYFLNILLLFLVLFEDKVLLPVFFQVTGRMHPMVVHFPLVLFFVGIFLEWLITRQNFQHRVAQDITEMVFCFFALSAAFTALFGFFLFREGSYLGDEILWHKWAGTVVSLLGTFIVWIRERAARSYYYATLTVVGICLITAGHVGSEVTHGEGFLTEPIRRQRSRIIEIEHPDSAIVFRDVIQPILNEKCLNCHNANRAKNDFIVADYQNLMKGGENRNAIVAGKAHASLIYKYITLPMDDSLHMPPQGKMQLDREEIRLIGWWINTGAGEQSKYVSFPKADSIEPIMASKFQPKRGLDLVEIAFADQSKIKELNNPYRTVQQISASRPYIAVFLGTKKDFTTTDLAELAPISDQVVSIDLGSSHVTDQDLKALTQFPHLQKLHLQSIDIGDDGVQYLRGLRFLDVINLSGTKISSRSLEEIASWKNLKKLYVYNTSIDNASIQTLKAAHPGLEVYNTQFDLTDSLYNAQLSVPLIKIDSSFFKHQASIDIKPSRGRVKYFYSLDGSPPTAGSTLYTGPFHVGRTCELKVIATMDGWIDSKISTFQFMKVGLVPDRVILKTKYDPKLSGKNDSLLFNGQPGSLDRNAKEYLAFVKNDLEAVFEIATPSRLSQVTLSYLEDVAQGVLPPVYVEAWGGDESTRLAKLGRAESADVADGSPAAKGLLTINFPERPVRFVRLRVKNRGTLPAGHPLENKSKATMFIDEVALE